MTITLPPIFPLKIAQYILSYILHRLRNWLRRRYGFTPPSVVGNESQKNLNFHKHVVFFGIPRIMKESFWLDDKVIRFLGNMGRHIQKTVNNRLKPEEVREFDKMGDKLLRRYLRYRRKHRRYQGPVNWLTKIRRDDRGE
ncbi:hypothetical protein DRO21_05230 [archaeon]|nr:MAG: hypothetical protein DRO21_05230 [archaeon]